MVPLSSRITFVDIDNVSYSGGIENIKNALPTREIQEVLCGIKNNGWHDELEDYSCFSVNPDNS
jgi:hypothetical protein